MIDPKMAYWKALERKNRDLFWRELRGEQTEEESARLNEITKRLGTTKAHFLWCMWHIAYNTVRHKDREAGLRKDPHADTGPKEPVGQESDPDGPAGQDMSPEINDLPELENMNEDAALQTLFERIVLPDIEIMWLLQDRDAHYYRLADCAKKKKDYRRCPAVDNLVCLAQNGKLNVGKIHKLTRAVAGDGKQFSPDETRAFLQYAEDRGQTLEEFLQILVEINRFVGKTGEDDFNCEDNHAGMIDRCARIPLFLPAAFANIDVMRTPDRRYMLEEIIALQADELKAQAKGRGTWPLIPAVLVAKALIINYSSLLQNGDAVGADGPPNGGPTGYGAGFLCRFKEAHEAASVLLKKELCESHVEKAQFEAFCRWLREEKVRFPPELPWDAPKDLREGRELLLEKFDRLEKPPAAAPAVAAAPTVNPPEPRANTEMQAPASEPPAPSAALPPPCIVGKLVILEWNKCLKYGGEVFTINGDERWDDIRALIDANGEYVEMEKGFPQRFAQGDAKRFKKVAIEAQGPRRKGTGRYKIKP